MIEGFAALLLFQLAGEAISHLAHWPVPGPIVGLLLLLAWSALGGRLGQSGEGVARGLLANLGLMFVPVSAGILYQLRSLGAAAWDVVWVVVVATAITLVATAATFTLLSRHVEDDAS
jgi:holin-like protein